ncbi:MAG TPA: peptidase, partial [Planctomycetaceae bacterium]|nr:peptidase [Planctomycetaceae bacterium]
MDIPIKPIYLFADSQLLFWKKESGYFLENIVEHFATEEPTAAYIAVSNDAKPEFFDLFRAAMEIINITDCRMIGSKVSVVDEVFLNN